MFLGRPRLADTFLEPQDCKITKEQQAQAGIALHAPTAMNLEGGSGTLWFRRMTPHA